MFADKTKLEEEEQFIHFSITAGSLLYNTRNLEATADVMLVLYEYIKLNWIHV